MGVADSRPFHLCSLLLLASLVTPTNSAIDDRPPGEPPDLIPSTSFMAPDGGASWASSGATAFSGLGGGGFHLDVLSALLSAHRQLNNATSSPPPFSLHPGPHSPSPAALFADDDGDARSTPALWRWLAPPSPQQHGRELALMASVRQRRGNVGTILMLTAGDDRGGGDDRLLELQSSGRQDELRLHYRSSPSPLSSSSSSSMAVVSIPLALADDLWHKLAVVLSGSQINVFLDCRSVYQRMIHPLDFRIFHPDSSKSDNITFWVGQRKDQRHFLFKGFLQDLHLVSGDPQAHLMRQCPESDSLSCPTCGQFQAMRDTIQQMQASYLQEIRELKDRLSSAESRLSSVEECDCRKSCRAAGGKIWEDGATWNDEGRRCSVCACVRGEIVCRRPQCPQLNCTDPHPADPDNGVCCPTCKADCRHFGVSVPHGASHSPRRCVRCDCHDGRLHCDRTDPLTECPKDPGCPEEERVLEDGRCCPVCKADHCTRYGPNACHPLADCINGVFNLTCHCQRGFEGDGVHNCQDIDECSTLGGYSGHHCTSPNSVCINTIGSYRCECAEGFKDVSVDGLQLDCRPIDPCLEEGGSELCPGTNAMCVHRGPGKHECRCQPGFEPEFAGSQNCKPSCPGGCKNGGHCDSPAVCKCPPGFSGPDCSADIDECGLGESVHQCGEGSTCVNHHGWHECQCPGGFHQFRDRNGVTTCADVDECTLAHTCSENTYCVNTPGSYHCLCKDPLSCNNACLVDGVERVNGSTWRGHNDGSRCQQVCTCVEGRVECSRDCSSFDVEATSKALHEAASCDSPFSDQKHRSGEKWIERCQECECLDGEVDCWPLTCPSCNNHEWVSGGDDFNILLPVFSAADGQLCPIHDDDKACCPPCGGERSPNGGRRSCVHGGMVAADGGVWRPDEPECATCTCKGKSCSNDTDSSGGNSAPVSSGADRVTAVVARAFTEAEPRQEGEEAAVAAATAQMLLRRRARPSSPVEAPLSSAACRSLECLSRMGLCIALLILHAALERPVRVTSTGRSLRVTELKVTPPSTDTSTGKLRKTSRSSQPRDNSVLIPSETVVQPQTRRNVSINFRSNSINYFAHKVTMCTDDEDECWNDSETSAGSASNTCDRA